MEGMATAGIMLLVFLPALFIPIIRNHNRDVVKGIMNLYKCDKCRYQGNNFDELDNHKRLTLHNFGKVME